jgi:hypothetical protein
VWPGEATRMGSRRIGEPSPGLPVNRVRIARTRSLIAPAPAPLGGGPAGGARPARAADQRAAGAWHRPAGARPGRAERLERPGPGGVLDGPARDSDRVSCS